MRVDPLAARGVNDQGRAGAAHRPAVGHLMDSFMNVQTVRAATKV
jgi:hypothetical protein